MLINKSSAFAINPNTLGKMFRWGNFNLVDISVGVPLKSKIVPGNTTK
ncbi:MAG: hypothetical protein Ct9H300mP4_17410 [Gammaproteobacteria bacterium]|nr:MAG: hypothetical protein Ct9H300mP4_17410 [Gammaproteobacteria bacterium]